MRVTHLKRLSTVLFTLGLAACVATSGAATGKPKPHKKPHKVVKKAAPALAPGTYSGTVQMGGVTVGTSTYQATLDGTWTITVDAHERATGSETLQATVPFTSPDSNGCTYSPTSWTLGFKGQLGTDTLAGGTPGAVKGGDLVISLSNTGAGGWSGSPAQYTRTCGAYSAQWDTGLAFGFGPSTGSPVETTVQFPLSFFKRLAGTYALQIGTVEKATFTQTYTLQSVPK